MHFQNKSTLKSHLHYTLKQALNLPGPLSTPVFQTIFHKNLNIFLCILYYFNVLVLKIIFKK